jgi:hypothetical protein
MLSPWYYGHILTVIVVVVVVVVVVVEVVSPVDSEYIRTWYRSAVRELSMTQNSRAPSVEKTCDDVICGQINSALTTGFKKDSNIQNCNLSGFLYGCDTWFVNFVGSM